jgi:Uma2 family endonuclease
MRNKISRSNDFERDYAMGQPAVSALAPLPFELVFNDGEPLETGWHALQLPFLWELIHLAMVEQGRSDFFVGGDMFVYYSMDQARDVARGRPYFRGPDIFWVDGVEPGMRKGWVSWEEGGRLPDVIVELLSPSTAEIDRTEKRDLYARVFRTSEYFLYDPETRKLEGLSLRGRAYQPMEPDDRGWFWSEQLGAFLGPWHGFRLGVEGDWLRLFHPDGTLLPATAERAESERLRAETAEAELARLRALLQGKP